MHTQMLLIRLQLYISIPLSVFEYINLISTNNIENIMYTDKELNAVIKHIINANYGIYDIKSYATPPMIASSTEKSNSCVGEIGKNFSRKGI